MDNFYSILGTAESTVTSTTGMQPSVFYFLLVCFIVLIGFLAFLWLKPRADSVTVMGPYVLEGTSLKPRPNSIETVMTQQQITSSLGNNFTLSFFVYMDDVNRERIPIAGPKGDFRFKPFLYILGVGDVLLDPIHQIARVRIRPLTKGALINPDIKTSIDVENFMIARWNQLTITMEGRTVDVYLNGALAASTLLENLPILNPSGVLLETSPDFSGQAGLIQAWPHRLTEAQILKNYKRNTNVRGKPHIPDVTPTLKSMFTTMGAHLCELGFCGFRISTSALDYVDYQFA